MNATTARKLAEEAIQNADREGYPVADTTVVGIDKDGYFWVTDNGEEVNHLLRDRAVEIIVENLTAGEEEG